MRDEDPTINTPLPLKGSSVIRFPRRYTVVDIETTGLNREEAEIIEIGAVRYEDEQPAATFSSLIQPPLNARNQYVDPFITQLTGISNSMLETAPQTAAVIRDFSFFLEDDLIVGYNVGFDVGFLNQNFIRYLAMPLDNDYMDVLRLARRLHPELAHHRLVDMAAYYQIADDQAHRALNDVLVTGACYQKLKQEALAKYGSEEKTIRAFRPHGTGHADWIHAADIQGTPEKQDPDSPLYEKHVVVTGRLSRLSRRQVLQKLADLGAVNEDRVGDETEILVLGRPDGRFVKPGGKSTKQKEAEARIGQGQEIQVVSEEQFYAMLEGKENR